MIMKKRLRRSTKSNVIMGVCGGIAEYLGLNPIGLRAITIVMLFISGVLPVLLVYFALGLLIKKDE
jgi:phage shock protein C